MQLFVTNLKTQAQKLSYFPGKITKKNEVGRTNISTAATKFTAALPLP